MEYIKTQQEQILKELGRYKFLTVRQMVKIGISTEQYIRVNLRVLREKGLIDRKTQGIQSRLGKSEDIHFLTIKGAKLLSEGLNVPLETIHYPKGKSILFIQDYFHRVATINTKISFYLWAESKGYEVDFFHTYFDMVGSVKSKDQKLRPKTFLQLQDGRNLIPDSILRYKTSNNSFLYCLEVYNGHFTKRVSEQLIKLMEGTFEGLPSEKYNHSKGNRNLIVFDTENGMKSVIERIKTSPEFRGFENVSKFLYFNTLEAIQSDFGALWHDLRGNTVNLSSF